MSVPTCATTNAAAPSTSKPWHRSAGASSPSGPTTAWPGSATRAGPSSGSISASPTRPEYTSRSRPRTGRPSTRSTPRVSPPAARTTARRVCAGTTRTTTARSCSTPTATTSRPSATSRNRLTRVPWDVLSDEQRELRDLVRQLARERIAPRAAEIDASHEFPWDVVELFRENDIFGLFFAEEYGGLGTGTLLSLVAIEEVSKVCATSGLILAVQELGSLGLKLAGTEEQKERYLPRLASGEWLCAYALTESGSGSDSAAMRTTARREGDEYVLDGSKRFITNAGVAN